MVSYTVEVKEQVYALAKEGKSLENNEQFCFACGVGLVNILNSRTTAPKFDSSLRANIVRSATLRQLKNKLRDLIKKNLNYVGNLKQEEKNLYSCIVAYDADDTKIKGQMEECLIYGVVVR